MLEENGTRRLALLPSGRFACSSSESHSDDSSSEPSEADVRDPSGERHDDHHDDDDRSLTWSETSLHLDGPYSRPRSSCTHSTGLKLWQGQKPQRWTSHREPWRHMWERQDAAWRRRPGRKFKDGPGIASPVKGQSGGKNTSSRPPMSKDLDDELGADPGTKTSLLPALHRRIPCRPRYFCNHRFLAPNASYFVFLPKPCPYYRQARTTPRLDFGSHRHAAACTPATAAPWCHQTGNPEGAPDPISNTPSKHNYPKQPSICLQSAAASTAASMATQTGRAGPKSGTYLIALISW